MGQAMANREEPAGFCSHGEGWEGGDSFSLVAICLLHCPSPPPHTPRELAPTVLWKSRDMLLESLGCVATKQKKCQEVEIFCRGKEAPF